MNFFEYITSNQPEILFRISEHLQLTVLAVTIAILVGVPLGIIISYVNVLKKPVLGFSNIVQAIPSLALLGFLIPFLGIGSKPAIFMVVVYSLLPIVKNTTTGLEGINKQMTEAAKGIGMTNLQILTKVKLPLALPFIMAGVRISAVTSVGLVTLAAFIGAGGLGYLVYSGIRTVNNNQILAGAIPACLMALSIDFLAAIVEKSVTPMSFTTNVMKADSNSIKRYKTRKKIVLSLTALLLTSVLAVNFFGNAPKENTIIIGAKDFTEQEILGNIYAELIKDKTNLNVELKTGLGSQIVFSAIENSEIDMYIEYTGTVYGNILGYSDQKTTEEIYQISVQELKEKYNLQMLQPLGFNNTYTLSVLAETAEKYNLTSISDLAKVSNNFILGASFEILNRPDGIPNLIKEYNLSFKETIGIDGSPRYTAIKNNEIQVTDAFSTDGLLIDFGLVVLEDDKNFFPPYYATPIIRPAITNQYPELIDIFNTLEGTLTDDIIRSLNYEVDVKKLESKDVAIKYLRDNNMIK